MHRSEAGRQLNAQIAEAKRRCDRHDIVEITSGRRCRGFDLTDDTLSARA